MRSRSAGPHKPQCHRDRFGAAVPSFDDDRRRGHGPERLHARRRGGRRTDQRVTVDGSAQSSAGRPTSRREILRFRNNNVGAYAQTPLLVPDAASCARSGAAPDTIAPELAQMPAPFTVAAIDARGTPASDPSIADVLASVTAIDDRPAAAALENDAPAIVPARRDARDLHGAGRGGQRRAGERRRHALRTSRRPPSSRHPTEQSRRRTRSRRSRSAIPQ